MNIKHLDEAKRDALNKLKMIVKTNSEINKIVLIDDLFGRLRIVVWLPGNGKDNIIKMIDESLLEAAGPFWTKEIFLAEDGNQADQLFYESAWDESIPFSLEEPRLRVGERRRNRSAWFGKTEEPAWPLDGSDPGPPIITFYSFKGGVGRTTALGAFAIQRARSGQRVAIIDMDLDAPGAGVLFAADEKGITSQWGVIDYFLEHQIIEPDFRDYYHVCRRSAVSRNGEIFVVPAGSLSSEHDYLNKLSRVDFELSNDDKIKHPLYSLLQDVKKDLKPDWLLLDARAGLSEPAGLLLGGISHLNVLFGTSSEQSWQGIRTILDRLGAFRVRQGLSQLECILVHAMVPEDTTVGNLAKMTFEARALEEFGNYYYAKDPEDQDEDRFWYIRDSEGSDAPHVPVALSYQPKLAHFERIDQVSDALSDSPEFKALCERILQRFLPEQE